MEEEKKKKHQSGCFKSLKTVFNASSRHSHWKEEKNKKKEGDDHEAIVMATAEAAKAAEAAVEAAEKVVRLAGYPNSLDQGVQSINKKELEAHLITKKGDSGEGSSSRRKIVLEDGKLPNYMMATQSAEAKVRINIPKKTPFKNAKWC